MARDITVSIAWFLLVMVIYCVNHTATVLPSEPTRPVATHGGRPIVNAPPTEGNSP